MLRITASMNAKSYFNDGLSRDDYLSERQEIVGGFGGKLAARLGIDGEVTKEVFDKLCDNLHPLTGEPLTARTKSNRIQGYDWTFSTPKSVSLLYAHSGDERILRAFEKAVAETMAEAEREMKCRVRKGGRDENDRITGEWAYGSFLHKTARPTEHSAPDPHLHIHAFVLNATWDADEKMFKAGFFGDLKRDAVYWQAAADSRLALGLRELGYEIERTKGGYEIAGIDRVTLDKFSLRTKEVEAEARRKGVVNADEKAMLGASTRHAKAKDMTWSELREDWFGRLDPSEHGQLARVARGEGEAERHGASLERAFDYAVAKSFERSATVSEKRLMAEVLTRGVGTVSVEQAATEARRAGNGVITREVDGQRISTTREVLAEEQAMLAWARDGRGTCPALAPSREVADGELSDEQKDAVRHVWRANDRVVLVRGSAGVGKTRLMQEVVAGLAAEGVKTHAFAPSADASRGTLRNEGFSDANTLATLLGDPKTQEQVRGGLIWVDEAGQIGTRDMAKVFDIAERHDARVLLSGDPRQHGSVSRGSVLRLLEDRAGIRSARLTTIRRQAGRYREAVMALSRGEADKGFAVLDELGKIKELGEDRHRRMAADYVEAVRGHKGERALKRAICIAPTHAEGEKVTAEIRGLLKEERRLGGNERSFLRLAKLSLTEAERGDALAYKSGDVVQLVQNVKGFRRGERLTVTGRDAEGLVVAERSDGESVHVPLSKPERFQVFRRSELAVAEGETVRVTNNGFSRPGLFGRKHRLDNGSLHVVKGFTREGDLKLANGWVVPKDFGHLSHGYCQTSYSSQSRTVDKVFVAQGMESLPATDMKQFYVSVSRGRTEALIYTDDKEALLDRVRRGEDRMSAVELVAEGSGRTETSRERSKARAALNVRLGANDPTRERPKPPEREAGRTVDGARREASNER